MQKSLIYLLNVLLFTAACDNQESSLESALFGGLQKGPFLLGSTVEISLLSAVGNPTGLTFRTTTIDDLGRFRVVLTEGGNAEVVGTGYYYNETAGELSASTITLHALARVSASGGQEVYVNAFTQMAYKRALSLLQSGIPLDNAVQQAEEELRLALGIIHPAAAASSGSSMNILGGDTSDSEYLLGLSCIVSKAAQLAPGGSPDANLQSILNTVSLDLAADGEIDEAVRRSFADAEKLLDPGACMQNLQAYLESRNSDIVVPDISKVIDSDKDGTANADDMDDDGDNVLDFEDCAPLDPTIQTVFADGSPCASDTSEFDSDSDSSDVNQAIADCEQGFAIPHVLLLDDVTCAVDDDDDDDDGVDDAFDCAPLDPGVAADCWTDIEHRLVWQLEPDQAAFTWQEAIDYCDQLDLGGSNEWHLPTISELRSSLRGCPSVNIESALCRVGDDCLGAGCGGTDCCNCAAEPNYGNVCFWDPALQGLCNTGWDTLFHWSSSTVSDRIGSAWYIHFGEGCVNDNTKSQLGFVRCVRTNAN